MRHAVLLFAAIVLLGGCAIGNTHRYDLGDAALEVETDKTVAVTAVDLRPYVRPDDKDATFVGLMRGGFGNPFNITTDSGRPLAEDLTVSMVAALQKSDVKAQGVTTATGVGESAAREALLKARAERFVLLLIREWKTDTYMNTELINDVALEVLGPGGAKLADKTLKGRETLGGAFVPADVRVNAEKAIKRKLEEAFNDPAVASALR